VGEFTVPLLHYNVASSLREVEGETADVEVFLSGDVFTGTSTGAAIHTFNIKVHEKVQKNLIILYRVHLKKNIYILSIGK
jgi:hypothetical protein